MNSLGIVPTSDHCVVGGSNALGGSVLREEAALHVMGLPRWVLGVRTRSLRVAALPLWPGGRPVADRAEGPPLSALVARLGTREPR